MFSRFNSSDFIAAAAPVLGSITLADVNSASQILGACLGAAYLIWKWRREATAPAPAPTSPASSAPSA